MNKLPAIVGLIVLCTTVGFSQKPGAKIAPAASVDTKAADAEALVLAKAALSAHGGDKFKGIKTLVVRGSVEMTSAAFPQAIPGGFSLAYTGEKYRMEFSTIVQSFKQTFDGVQTNTNVPSGFALPPINRLGLPLLQRLGDEGFVVSALPATSKKKLGFRITAPDGYFTDFFLDEKTKQVKGYEAMYEYGGRMFSTSVEIGKYRDIDGVTFPDKYSQRFDLGQLVVYGDFKTKEVLINTELAADVFPNVK